MYDEDVEQKDESIGKFWSFYWQRRRWSFFFSTYFRVITRYWKNFLGAFHNNDVAVEYMYIIRMVHNIKLEIVVSVQWKMSLYSSDQYINVPLLPLITIFGHNTSIIDNKFVILQGLRISKLQYSCLYVSRLTGNMHYNEFKLW